MRWIKSKIQTSYETDTDRDDPNTEPDSRRSGAWETTSVQEEAKDEEARAKTEYLKSD